MVLKACTHNDSDSVSDAQAKRRKTFQRVGDEDPSPSGARTKRTASDDLAFVEALVSTGAADESEVNWASLSSTYPRASLLWKTLRGDRKKQSPYRDLGFQEVRPSCAMWHGEGSGWAWKC